MSLSFSALLARDFRNDPTMFPQSLLDQLSRASSVRIPLLNFAASIAFLQNLKRRFQRTGLVGEPFNQWTFQQSQVPKTTP
jgi:hypothetical protein